MSNSYLQYSILVFLLSTFFSFPANSQPDTLVGDDLRPALAEKGIEVDAVLTNDLIANTSGGVDRTTRVLGNFDLTASIDTEKSGLWDGGTFFTYFLGNYGGDPSEFVGDSQVMDNIEAYDTFKLYEAWYNHDFFDGTFGVLAGLHDYNSEFLSLEYSGVLLNSSFGISPTISQVGPSIFSTTAVGTRFKLLPAEELYVLGGLYDGVPGDPNHPRGTRIRFDDGDGIFYAGEFGYEAGEDETYSKLGFGIWHHTAEFTDYGGRDRDSNTGYYLIGELKPFSECEDPAQGLGGFFQIAYADPDRNPVARYFGAGAAYTGLFPGRDEDILSLGAAYARFSSGIRESDDLYSGELAVELTYRILVLPYLAVQPDIQFIHDPSGDRAIQDAWVVGLRTELAL